MIEKHVIVFQMHISKRDDKKGKIQDSYIYNSVGNRKVGIKKMIGF